MHKLLMKEVKLSSHPLSFVFIVFSFMFLIPGYPILCAPFFVTLGLFQSFQKARENGDILFSLLLPVPKRDTVKGKFIFVLLIELSSAFLMALSVILRVTLMRKSPVYLSNPMMRADLYALSIALLIFSIFNFVFVGGFFRTAKRIGLPFLLYSVSAFIVIALGEALSHLSFMDIFDDIWGDAELAALSAGCILYSLITLLSYRISVRRFERVDL